MNWVKKLLPPVAVILGAIGICYRFFGFILNDPGSYIFSSSEDGVKNYFTVFYQVLHGEGTHFKGLLYPHGDLHLFADGQPVLTSFLKLFYDSTTPIETLLGTMNSILILGSVVCAFFVYLLLRKANVGRWASVAFALIIAFLSPQLDRLGGHYALAYSFFIPAIWYFLLQSLTVPRKWMWAALYCLTVLIFSLNQPYYLIIATALSGSMMGWYLIRNWLILKKGLSHLPVLITSFVLPAMAMVFFLSSVDTVTDRPTAPFGLGSYDASFSGTFVPVNGPMSYLVRTYLLRIFEDPAWEARAFVGIPASFFLLFLIWRTAAGFLQSGMGNLKKRRLPISIAISLIPAFIVLAFASGNLHKYGLFLLYDVLPQLKQFRSLGRLAWAFYFIFTVSAASYFYMVFRYLRMRLRPNRIHASVVLFLICGVWTVDAVSNIKSAKNLIGVSPKPHWRLSNAMEDDIESAGIDTSNYQAILPLPFALIGSEKLMKTANPWAFSHSVDLSLKTGLPMFGGHMSRTSWSTTQDQSQLVAHPILPKPFVKELDRSKRILVLWSYADLTEGEEFILHNSTVVWKNEHYQCYSISVDELISAHSKFREMTLAAAGSTGTELFDSGSMAMQGQQIFNGFVTDSTTHEHEVSYWTKIDLEVVGTVKSTGLIDHADGTTTEFKVNVDESSDVVGDWIRASNTVELKPGANKIRMVSEFCDGLITPVKVRRLGSDEFEPSTDSWNNYPLLE